MPLYAWIFWIWTVVSTAIFVARRVRAHKARKARNRAMTRPTPRPAEPRAETQPEPAETRAELPDLATIRQSMVRSVAEVVQGIQLPCELGPLVGSDTDLRVAARRATFSTTGYPTAHVHDAVLAEMQRLGLDVRPTGPQQFIATRGAEAVRVTTHSNSTELFKTAAAAAVVVELDLL
jgi:hypothetical protein